MYRARTLFTAAALVAGALSLAAAVPKTATAQCAHADLCSQQTCKTLQRDVHPACDQERSCRKIKASNKGELLKRLLINQSCLIARQDVARCFSRSDRGHREAIASVQNAIDTCRDKLNPN